MCCAVEFPSDITSFLLTEFPQFRLIPCLPEIGSFKTQSLVSNGGQREFYTWLQNHYYLLLYREELVYYLNHLQCVYTAVIDLLM